MAKVFGPHIVMLRSGVDPEEFEEWAAEALPRMPCLEGFKHYILKGIRGDREGRYLWIIEIESVEANYRYYPDSGPTEELLAFEAAHAEELQAFWEQWLTFSYDMDGAVFTDYVVLAETGG